MKGSRAQGLHSRFLPGLIVMFAIRIVYGSGKSSTFVCQKLRSKLELTNDQTRPQQ